VGELRGRAARMEPIKDLGELLPILDSLVAKGLIQYLTPHGRGAVVTHALYLDREMEKVRREAGAIQSEEAPREIQPAVRREVAPVLTTTQPPAGIESHAENSRATADIAALRDQLNTLKQELAAAKQDFESTAAELRRDLDELNRQLGN
jgi:uncharacterized protein